MIPENVINVVRDNLINLRSITMDKSTQESLDFALIIIGKLGASPQASRKTAKNGTPIEELLAEYGALVAENRALGAVCDRLIRGLRNTTKPEYGWDMEERGENKSFWEALVNDLAEMGIHGLAQKHLFMANFQKLIEEKLGG
jgi:hypothetical protein